MARRLLSIRVEDELLRKARRVTRATTDSEAVRRALELASQLDDEEAFWKKWGGKGGPRAFESLD